MEPAHAREREDLAVTNEPEQVALAEDDDVVDDSRLIVAGVTAKVVVGRAA